MSSKYFDPDNQDPYLSFDEKRILGRLLAHPEDFPHEFWSAIYQKVALNGEQIPKSQVAGLTQSEIRHATVGTSETTASTSYTDLATVGPRIDGLSDGFYVAFFYCQTANSAAGNNFISISPNTTTASDADSINIAPTATGDPRATGFAGSVFELRNNNNNMLTLKYKVSAGTGHFVNRRMFVLKVGS